jgi:hypothetical protein
LRMCVLLRGWSPFVSSTEKYNTQSCHARLYGATSVCGAVYAFDGLISSVSGAKAGAGTCACTALSVQLQSLHNVQSCWAPSRGGPGQRRGSIGCHHWRRPELGPGGLRRQYLRRPCRLGPVHFGWLDRKHANDDGSRRAAHRNDATGMRLASNCSLGFRCCHSRTKITVLLGDCSRRAGGSCPPLQAVRGRLACALVCLTE